MYFHHCTCWPLWFYAPAVHETTSPEVIQHTGHETGIRNSSGSSLIRCRKGHRFFGGHTFMLFWSTWTWDLISSPGSRYYMTPWKHQSGWMCWYRSHLNWQKVETLLASVSNSVCHSNSTPSNNTAGLLPSRSIGQKSWLRINRTKLVLFPVLGAYPNTPESNPLQIAASNFKYLGMQITTAQEAFNSLNFHPVLQEFEIYINPWILLPVSLMWIMACLKWYNYPNSLTHYKTLPTTSQTTYSI